MAERVTQPGQQFVALSSAVRKAEDFGIAGARVFGFGDWVGGRYSLWGPIGLSLMVAIGPERFEEMLAGAREMDQAAGVMKKCTLCVDRIYNENLPEEDRVPSCVRTCPSGARHFGDLGDESSEVSQLVAARGGMDLMPELGTKPVNKYLPPRPKDVPADLDILAPYLEPVSDTQKGFLGWLDKALEKL